MYCAKKSYCETCLNEKCTDTGKRNIHFCGSNQCSRYLSKEDIEQQRLAAEESAKRAEEYLDDMAEEYARVFGNFIYLSAPENAPAKYIVSYAKDYYPEEFSEIDKVKTPFSFDTTILAYNNWVYDLKTHSWSAR